MTLRDIKPYVQLPFHGVILPFITITPEQRAAAGAKEWCTNLEFLTQLCRVGWKRKVAGRVPKEKWDVYRDRVKEELAVIQELGFVDYIVMVWDLCDHTDRQGIPRGPGRGSVSGSLISFLIGVSALDPVEHGLFFTRFLSKARAKSHVVDGVRYIEGSLVPDVDLDYSFYRRGEVIEYLHRRYPGQTSKLLTTTTFTSKILIKDVLKVYENATEEQANEASGLIEKEAGIPEDLEVALYGDKKWLAGDKEDGKPPNERFVKWAEKHEDTVKLAMGLSDLNRGEGQHASAVLIAHTKITDLLPLQLSSSKESISGFSMESAQEVTVKTDVLGLRGLDVIAEACRLVGVERDAIDIHHPSIYAYLQDFKYRYGIFQLETFAQGNAAAKVKPRTFEQLGAVLAVARPGAMAYLDQLAAYVNEDKYTEVDPLVDSVLKPTGGVCLFQEQLLQMVNRLGMDLDECEALRRCVTKDTKFVSKTRGWVTIETLMRDGYKDDLFLVMDEIGRQQWKPISNIWSNGTKEVRYVRARNGMWVRATGWHQFLTDKGWKAKRNITEDDYLVCAKSVRYDGRDAISPELAMVIAGLVTEGYFVEQHNWATFVNWDAELMATFSSCYTKEFGENRLSYDQKGRVARVRAKERQIISQVMSFGKSNVKRLPDVMMGMTEATTRRFLGFMWSCEATVMDGELSFTSASYQLIQQVQLLLLRFDIRSNLILKRNEEYDRFYFVLHVGQYADVVRFNEALGPYVCTTKRVIIAQRASIVKEETHTTEMIPPSVMSQYIQQYGMHGEEGSGSVYRCGVSANKFRRIVATSKDKRWIEFSNGKHEYTKVESLTDLYDREVEVFDFTVDDDTPFIIANGLVIHNCIGKKKVEEIPQWKAKIFEVAEKNGHSKDLAVLIWKIAEDSGGYQFNKAHSSAYAMITAWTLYLKANHPLQFYLALLRMARHESAPHEVIQAIEQEMRVKGITLLPPHFIKSRLDFEIEGTNSIRFALGLIRGISDKNAEKLDLFRAKAGTAANKYEVFQAARNAGLHIGLMCSLIQAGCLAGYDSYVDSKGVPYHSRSRVVLEACTFNLLTDAEKGHLMNAGARPEIGWDVLKAIKYLAEVAVNDKGKPLINARRFATIQKRYQPYKDIYLQNSRNERLANYWYEKTVLGYSYSETISSIFSEHVDGLVTVEKAKGLPKDSLCRVIGFVAEEPVKSKTSKGNDQLRFVISDETGQITVRAFNERIGLIEQQNGRLPVEGDLLIANLKCMGDAWFIQNGPDGTCVGIQSCKIFMRLSELKDAKAKDAEAEQLASAAAFPAPAGQVAA